MPKSPSRSRQRFARALSLEELSPRQLLTTLPIGVGPVDDNFADGAGDDDHGDDAATATHAMINTKTVGDIEIGGDIDWFAYAITSAGTATFGTTLGSLSDTVMSIYGPDGQTEIATDDDSGPGLASRITYHFTEPGIYFLEVGSFGSNTGSYALDVASEDIFAAGDFNGDGIFDCLDIDGLISAIASGGHADEFDLTDDGLVDLADRDAWLAIAGAANLPSGQPYLLGDADLNGVVDGVDFVSWNVHKFTDTASWCAGDFNANGRVDGIDFVFWNSNKFRTTDANITLPAPDQPSRSASQTHHLQLDARSENAVERDEHSLPIAAAR